MAAHSTTRALFETTVAGFDAGQTITIDTGVNLESAVIAMVGTAGATTAGAAVDMGAAVIAVANTTGFSASQTITVDRCLNQETAGTGVTITASWSRACLRDTCRQQRSYPRSTQQVLPKTLGNVR